jgi:hypothetical protein
VVRDWLVMLAGQFAVCRSASDSVAIVLQMHPAAAPPPDVRQVPLAFDQVSVIAGFPLSTSARRPSWWRSRHDGAHARAWRLSRLTGGATAFTRL